MNAILGHLLQVFHFPVSSHHASASPASVILSDFCRYKPPTLSVCKSNARMTSLATGKSRTRCRQQHRNNHPFSGILHICNTYAIFIHFPSNDHKFYKLDIPKTRHHNLFKISPGLQRQRSCSNPERHTHSFFPSRTVQPSSNFAKKATSIRSNCNF